jgi:hypothetical protein
MTSAMAFLELNGVDTPENTFVLYEAMIAIANHTMDKAGLATLMRELFAN